MQKKRRTLIRLFAIALCGIVTFSICGCQKKDDAAEVKTYGKNHIVNLSVFCTGNFPDGFWNKTFTSSDGSTVNVTDYNFDYYNNEDLSYRDVLTKRLESNTDVDCYIISAEDVLSYKKNNYWMDLSDLDVAKLLSDDALLQSTYKGEVFSIPLAYTGFGFMWNMDMLEKYNLSLPTNQSEFMHVCSVLKSNGITPYVGNKGYALTVPALVVGLSEVYASNNREQLVSKLASGETTISTYMKRGFEFVETMVKLGYIDPEASLNSVPSKDDSARFIAGEGAFMCTGLGSQPAETPFKTAMTGIPVLEKGEACVVGAASRLAINPNGPNLSYAIEELDVNLNADTLEELAKSVGQLSSTKVESDYSYLDSSCLDFAKLIKSGNQVPVQDFTLPFNTWENARDLCRLILKGSSAEEVSKQFDDIQQKEIEAYQ